MDFLRYLNVCCVMNSNLNSISVYTGCIETTQAMHSMLYTNAEKNYCASLSDH